METETVQKKSIEKFRELNEQLKDFMKNLIHISSNFENDEDFDRNGISLISVKNDLLLHYLINLVGLMNEQSAANRNLNSNSGRKKILRLCEIRSFLEKIRPIEAKLKFEIDKILTTDENKKVFRANIENFQRPKNEENETDEKSNSEDEEEEKSSRKKSNEKNLIYRAPRIAPVEFNEDEESKNPREKIDKRLEHLKRRAFHSEILEEFRTKFSDDPEEIFNTERSKLLKKNRAYQEKIEYEENYFKRLPQTKRERLEIQRSFNNNAADHVTDHLDDADVLFDEFKSRSSKKKRGKPSRKTKKRLEKKQKKTKKRIQSKK